MTERLRDPKFDGKIIIEARKGHIRGGGTRTEILDATAKRME